MFKKSPEQRLERAKKESERAGAYAEKMTRRESEARTRPWWKVRMTKEALDAISTEAKRARDTKSQALAEVERLEDEVRAEANHG